MTSKIKTRLIKEGTRKPVEFKCPSCKSYISRIVERDIVGAITECGICGATIHWRDDNGK